MKQPLLVPVPKKLRMGNGERFAVSEGTRIYLSPECADGELEAALELADAFLRYAECRTVVDRAPAQKTAPPGIGLKLETGAKMADEAYRLEIGKDKIVLLAAHPKGFFYGVQTLIQLVRRYGRKLPALRIEDEPDFALRGFMLDVSRGRVPRLDFLKWLVHTLSHFKINMLQLYIEHTFHFRSHPEIGEGCDPLEPDEILELERYCRSRNVELVPSLQSFGHMGHILSLPKFRPLAEIVRFEDWEKASWRERMSGMTITPVDRGTYRLLGELYDDFLPLFSSRLFNLNSDETWDLGKGRSVQVAKRIGIGRLYLRHIAKIAELARRRGRTPMVWADIIHEHADLIGRVPEDVVLLDWGYSHDTPFDRCGRLAEAGRRFLVCPGTSGWNRVFNDVWNASRNIRGFAAAAKRHGAEGVLTTDWGDCGHFNMPGCSLHGAVLGAAVSWREGEPDDPTFDRAFSLHVFDDPKGTVGRWIRRAGSILRERLGKPLDTWELWTTPLGEHRPGREIPPEATGPIIQTVNEFVDAVMSNEAAQKRDPLSCLELSLGALMLGSLAMRAELDQGRLSRDAAEAAGAMTFRQWGHHAEEIREGYEEAWHRRSKPSRLREILRVFRRLILEAHRT